MSYMSRAPERSRALPRIAQVVFDRAEELVFAALLERVPRPKARNAGCLVQLIGTRDIRTITSVAGRLSAGAARTFNSSVLHLDGTGQGVWGDGNLCHGSENGFRPSEVAIPTKNDQVFWAGLGSLLHPMRPDLGLLLEAVRASYAFTVVECSATSREPAATLARLCDTSVILADGPKTEAVNVGRARELIETSGGHLLGAMLQRDSQGITRWIEVSTKEAPLGGAIVPFAELRFSRANLRGAHYSKREQVELLE